MLRTTKSMKEKYEKIQNYIFKLIPEKWEEIYLYASAFSNVENQQSGELFFYYLPKGILKKRPINVYEVPKRFNINEEQYLKIVEDLYKCIKSLQQDFIDTEQRIWTSLTLSIANFKFRVEYSYDTFLPSNKKERYRRNVIWKYKYLRIGGDSKEERRILEEFSKLEPAKTEIYETGLYIKNENNSINFDKEEIVDREFVIYEKDDILNVASNLKSKLFSNKNKVDKYQEYLEQHENKKEKAKSKNQILDS